MKDADDSDHHSWILDWKFSYGDDPNFAELANHAWYSFNSDVATHAVGQKAPNPWGLCDMEGNVWEWTQDWYGPYHTHSCNGDLTPERW